MTVVQLYRWRNAEYLVVDDRSLMLGKEGIRMLADRRRGIGADRVIVRSGACDIPALAYDAEGDATELTDWERALLRYAQPEVFGFPTIGADLSGFLSAELHVIEVRLTSVYCRRLQESDESVGIAC